MCNPRRVEIVATRQLQEAWEREVTRQVTLSSRVAGEARVCQPLDATLSQPVLRALEIVMAQPDSGWHSCEGGYRFEVEGGYALYLPEQGTLEIVARLEEEVEAGATVSEILRGEVETELSAKGKGTYYDDNYGGRTEAVAKREAEAAAQKQLDQEAGRHLAEVAEQAVAERACSIEAAAHQRAAEGLRQQEEKKRSQLVAQATDQLHTVGVRARHAFHQALACAYRDALLGFARLNQSGAIHCTEDDDVIEIEFNVQR